MLQHVSLCQKKKASRTLTMKQQAVFETAAKARAQSLSENGRHKKRKEADSSTSGSGDSDESSDSSDEPAAKKAKKDKEKKVQAKQDKKDKKEAEKEMKKKEKAERKEKEKEERREKEKEEKKKKKKEQKREKKAEEKKAEKEAKAKAAKRDARKSSGAAAMEDAVLDQRSSLSHLLHSYTFPCSLFRYNPVATRKLRVYFHDSVRPKDVPMLTIMAPAGVSPSGSYVSCTTLYL